MSACAVFIPARIFQKRPSMASVCQGYHDKIPCMSRFSEVNLKTGPEHGQVSHTHIYEIYVQIQIYHRSCSIPSEHNSHILPKSDFIVSSLGGVSPMP